jgi:osmotically-inducible protein OsmY
MDYNNDRNRISRREFLTGAATGSRPRFDEIDRENPSHNFWHPHEVGRYFDQESGPYRSDNHRSSGRGRRLNEETWQQDENGLYRGKGPRSYQRSDDRILEDINDRLCDNAYIDASEIEVEVTNGDVTLTGSVDNRNSKRLAEDIGDSVAGVKNVENRIRVKKSGI